MNMLDEPLIHTPRERRRQATLDRILVTATAMIVQEGYGALSMTRLAAELDYTPGALYRYFPSKDRLTIALVAQAIHDFRAAIEARSAPAGGPIARIVALALGYKEAALSAPNRFGLVAMLLADPRFVVEDTSEAGPALAALSGALEPLADAFTKAQTAGALTSGDAIRRALAIFASVHGVLQLRKQARYSPPLVDLDALASEVVGALLRGWGADAKALATMLPIPGGTE